MYTIYMSNSRDVHWYFVIDRNAYVLTQMCNTRVIIINLYWINMKKVSHPSYLLKFRISPYKKVLVSSKPFCSKLQKIAKTKKNRNAALNPTIFYPSYGLVLITIAIFVVIFKIAIWGYLYDVSKISGRYIVMVLYWYHMKVLYMKVWVWY